MQFAQLGLADAVLRAAASEGYSVATPIQAQAIPHVIAGKDVLGCAQTGTGKTAAFAMPVLSRLAAKPSTRRARCLVLAPTRELASQIADSFRTYGKNLQLRYSIIYGGVNQNPQVDTLRRGVDVIIATPGRLLDLYEQRHVDLSGIETLVLDEADRMLDMGFIHDIRKLVNFMPKQRQTLLFSATMPDEIRRLSGSILNHPVNVQVTPVASTAERVEQHVYFCEKSHKPALLAHLVNELPIFRAIVFTRTKHGADKVVRQLRTQGIESEAIHGNKSQNARERALKRFAAGKMPVLIATDIASRGIDIDDISHVVNFDLTHEPETYVHRIGRTARAGASGVAISFCDRDERSNLRGIEKLTRQKLIVKENPLGDAPAPRDEHPPREQRPQQGGYGKPQRAHGTQHPPKARPHGAKPQSGFGQQRPQRSEGQSGQQRFQQNSGGQANGGGNNAGRGNNAPAPRKFHRGKHPLAAASGRGHGRTGPRH